MGVKKLALATSASVILVGMICAAALYWDLDYWKSVAHLETASNEKIWNGVSCRGWLYLQKARGRVPELSWSELWELTRPGKGFHCAIGSSLEASLQYSAEASEADRRAGARIFRERCTGC